MPDLLGLFAQRDADVFLWRIDVVEQAKMNFGRVFGENREIDAVSEPGRAERIRFSGPGLNCRHSVRRCYPSRHGNAQSAIVRVINRVCGAEKSSAIQD